MAAATAAQAWAILTRHARDEVGPLRLQELCLDNDRVSSLVAVHTINEAAAARIISGNGANNKTSQVSANSPQRPSNRRASESTINNTNISSNNSENRILLADLSRQRMTLETVNHLLRLASARDVRGFIRTLAWGQNDRNNPVVPVRLRHQTGERGNFQEPFYYESSGGVQRDGHHAPLDEAASAGSMRVSPSEVGSSIAGIGGGGKHARFADAVEEVTTGASGGIGSNSGMGGPNNITAGFTTMRTSPSMHLALRAPENIGLEMLTADGINALDGIHNEWHRIERLSDSIRRGIKGNNIRDVLVVGRGVAVMAVQFIYEALRRDEQAGRASAEGLVEASSKGSGVDGVRSGWGHAVRKMRFVTSLDPASAASVASELNPATTVVITISLKGSEETMSATRTLRNWLIGRLGSNKRPEAILSKHMYFVTGNDRLFKSSKQESSFLVPTHSRCEAFTTLTAAGLLPLSIVFGWSIVKQILNGAHDLDTHFVETNPRHNLPVLLALADVWNDAFLGCSGRVITPFAEAFASYPAFVAALEAQTCGRARRGTAGFGAGSASRVSSAVVIDGGMSGTYDRVVYQGGRVIPSELVVSMDTQAVVAARTVGTESVEEAMARQDSLMCSFFAHADLLAFGSGGLRSRDVSGSSLYCGGLAPSASFETVSSHFGDSEVSDGNRPSSLLICGRCDAFACGQLVALAEHRAVVAARLWDVDPFAFAQTHGSAIRAKQTDQLKESLQSIYVKLESGKTNVEDDDEDDGPSQSGTQLNLATSTILSHYANRMQNQRVSTLKR